MRLREGDYESLGRNASELYVLRLRNRMRNGKTTRVQNNVSILDMMEQNVI